MVVSGVGEGARKEIKEGSRWAQRHTREQASPPLRHTREQASPPLRPESNKPHLLYCSKPFTGTPATVVCQSWGSAFPCHWHPLTFDSGPTLPRPQEPEALNPWAAAPQQGSGMPRALAPGTSARKSRNSYHLHFCAVCNSPSTAREPELLAPGWPTVETYRGDVSN